jgi:hypothetical protein
VGKHLFSAGRAFMVNAVLNTMPLHYMQGFMLPKWIIKTLTKIIRKFLWRGTTDKFSGGHCLVPWNKITLPKCVGGLGITDLHLKNQSLLTK